MSHGSWFSILRDDNKQMADDSVITQFFEEHDGILNDPLYKAEKTLDDIQDYFALDLKKHTVINVKNKKLYIELMNVHFNSEFDSLVKYYNMNAYTKHCQLKITYNQAQQMIQAIRYILSEKYEKQFEIILNNEYLEAFEDLYPIFGDRFRKKDEEYYESGQYKYLCELALCIFQRLLSVLYAYTTMVDEDFCKDNEYILIYNCY